MLNSDFLPKNSEGNNNELPKQTSEIFGRDSRMLPFKPTIERVMQMLDINEFDRVIIDCLLKNIS